MHRSSGWSSEKKLWSELTKFSQDLKWKKVAFDLNCEYLLPDHCGGVYLICAAAPQNVVTEIGAYTILYVGKVTSRSLRARFREHVGKPNPKLEQFVDCYYPSIHFWFSVLSDDSRISAIESLIKETFNPPCNSISPPGTRVLLARIGAEVPITVGRRRRT